MASDDGLTLAYSLLEKKDGDITAAILTVTIVRDIAAEALEVLESLKISTNSFDNPDDV